MTQTVGAMLNIRENKKIKSIHIMGKYSNILSGPVVSKLVKSLAQ